MKFSCPVVKIGKIEKLSNSDTLSITTVQETPVIIKTGMFQTGDLAIYIPEDSVLPMDRAPFIGVIKTDKPKHRLRAVRLRGTYSEGLLISLNGLQREEGCDMAPELGVTHYVEPEPVVSILGTVKSNQESPLRWVPQFEVEALLKNRESIPEGTLVEVTEKVHGSAFKAVYDDRLHVSSHNVWRRPVYKEGKFKQFVNKLFKTELFKLTPTNDCVWWTAAKDNKLAEKLKDFKRYVIYGEIYGKVQDLKYGIPNGVKLVVYAIFNANTRDWENPHAVRDICSLLELDYVPVLYSGRYVKEVVDPMRSGASTLHSQTIREGIVIKPLNNNGRNISLKFVSEEYKTRKNGSEYK